MVLQCSGSVRQAIDQPLVFLTITSFLRPPVTYNHFNTQFKVIKQNGFHDKLLSFLWCAVKSPLFNHSRRRSIHLPFKVTQFGDIRQPANHHTPGSIPFSNYLTTLSYQNNLISCILGNKGLF